MPPWLHWLLRQHHRLRRKPVQVGRLSAIFVADEAGAPMRSRDQALALVDAGLADDRYALGHGFWRLTDGCQVTLIHAEDLARAQHRYGLSLDAGQHRRNLVVSGLAQTELRHRAIRIGEAVFDWHRVRPPCGYLDRVSGPGTAKALGRQSGHCLRVRKAGLIQVGDRIEISAQDSHGQPMRQGTPIVEPGQAGASTDQPISDRADQNQADERPPGEQPVQALDSQH